MSMHLGCQDDSEFESESWAFILLMVGVLGYAHYEGGLGCYWL